MERKIIECRSVYKSFSLGRKTLDVLKGASLDLEKGERVVLVGPSGAGKSTLLYILGSLERPSAGEVFFRGQNIYNLNDKDLSDFRNHSIGFIFQFHHLLPEFTALENVMIPALSSGQKMKNARARAENLLSEVGLKEREDHLPSELSAGEAQRVAVARSLMNDPELILADEPTGNLDQENSKNILQLLKEVQQKHECTLLLVTHNPEIVAFGERVVEIVDGRINGYKKG